MRKKAGTLAALAALAGLIFLCQAGSGFLRKELGDAQEMSGKASGRENRLIIIDPGHGGLDAGKVGVNGKEEKEINLNISLKIQKLLKEQGVKVIMTRTEDERLADNQVEDLKARVVIQEALRETDPENTKKPKGNNTYYILKKTEAPVVIVECGFLSNYEEAEKLADGEYQQELAETVVKGIMEYLEGE